MGQSVWANKKGDRCAPPSNGSQVPSHLNFKRSGCGLITKSTFRHNSLSHHDFHHQRPSDLRESEFYKSLSCDESEEFNVPSQNFKLSPHVKDFEDLSHLLHTLQYWGASDLPFESVLFLLSHRSEECGKMKQLLSEIDWRSDLLVWSLTMNAFNDAGAEVVQRLTSYIAASSHEIRDLTIAALSKAGGACDEIRAHIISSVSTEFVQLYTLMHDFTPLPHARNVSRFLRNICNDVDIVLLPTLMPLLTFLLNVPDGPVLHDCCLVLSNNLQTFDQIQVVLEAGLAPRLVDLLSSKFVDVQAAALRAVGYIVAGSYEQAQMIIDLHALPALLTMVHSTNPVVLKDVLFLFENVIMGPSWQRQALLDANAFQELAKVVQSADFEHFTEFGDVTRMLKFGSPVQALSLLDMDIIPSLCRLLFVQDNKVLRFAHWTIERFVVLARGTNHRPEALFFTIMQQIIDYGEKIDRIKEDKKGTSTTYFRDLANRLALKYTSLSRKRKTRT